MPLTMQGDDFNLFNLFFFLRNIDNNAINYKRPRSNQ